MINNCREIQERKKHIRFYPWLVFTKNKNNDLFCKYCRVRFSRNLKRANHENTARHKEATKLHFKAESQKPKPKSSIAAPINGNPQASPKVSSKPKEETPKSIQAKVLMWKKRFPWLSYKRNELLPNYGYCKYCDQRVFVPTLKYASKHQKSLKHVRIQVQIRRKQVQAKTGVKKQQTLSKQNGKAVIANPSEAESCLEMQKKYPWILPDTKRQQHYGYCKYCNMRLLIKGAYKIKHQRSLKHRTAQKLYKRTASNPPMNENSMVTNDAQTETGAVETSPTVDDNAVDSSLRQTQISQGTNSEVENTRRPNASHDTAVDIATRLTNAHVNMLRMVQNLTDDNNCVRQNPSITSNNDCVSSCTHQSLPPQQPAQSTPPSRNTFDLFFESVSETVKTLPSDLAAEGRMKVMEIIYDLEMRALKRVTSSELQIN